MSSPGTLRSARTVYPARAGGRSFTAEDLWAIPRVTAVVPSPDGSCLAIAVTSYDMDENLGRSRLYLLAPSGGQPRPLTAAGFDSSQPAFSPDGRRLAFVRKRKRRRQNGDDEQHEDKPQLMVMPTDGGEASRWTDMPLGVTDPRWLADGSGIVFLAELLAGHLTPEATRAELERRRKDPVKAHVTEDRVYRFWDRFLTTGHIPHLFVVDGESQPPRDLIPESTRWLGLMELEGSYDVAPGGDEVAYTVVFPDGPDERLRTAVNVVPIAGGAPVPLTVDHANKAMRPRYSRDGASIVYGMNVDPMFYADRTRLMRYDRSRRKHEDLLVDWDRSPQNWEPLADGSLALRAEDDGRVGAYHLPIDAGEPRPVVTGGSVSSLRPAADGWWYFTHQTLASPAEVHRARPDRAEAPERLSFFTGPATDRFATGEVRDLSFTGAGDERVQMFVVLPPGHEPGRRYPLVHLIHGGPHGITADGFHPRWNAQLLAAPGYVVAAVNYQGSTSRGQDFAQRIQGAWGERPAADVLAATDLLVAEGLVDADEMAVAGGSYGGYLVSWLTCLTDRFRCGVTHAGAVDLLSMYATDVTYARGRSFGGEPWTDLAAIDRFNPARNTAKMSTPMLVIHGEKDFRVPVTQGLMCYNLLKGKGVPARLVYFPDENHWVLKPQNSRFWYREVHAWLARFLAGDETEASSADASSSEVSSSEAR